MTPDQARRAWDADLAESRRHMLEDVDRATSATGLMSAAKVRELIEDFIGSLLEDHDERIAAQAASNEYAREIERDARAHYERTR